MGKTVGDPNPQTMIGKHINIICFHYLLRKNSGGGGSMVVCLAGGHRFDSIRPPTNFTIPFQGHMASSGLATCQHLVGHPKRNILGSIPWNIHFLIFSKINLSLIKCP